MNINKLLVAALLATSIGAPTSSFAEERTVPNPITSTGIRVPFLHGILSGQLGNQTELAALERADEWLNSQPLTAPALRASKTIGFALVTLVMLLWDRAGRTMGSS